MSSIPHNRARRPRPSLRAAWKAASTIERRRFIAEILVDHLLPSAIGAPPPMPAAPAAPAASSPIDDAPGLDAFLSICVEKSPGGRVQSATLYDAYRRFAFARDEEPLTHKAVSTRLSQRGYVKRHSSVIWWLGVALVPAAGGATC